MHQVPRTILLFLFCVGITAPTRAAAPVVQAFLDRHCIDCHDDAEKKAGLSVESLKAAYSDPKLHRTWVRIFDRVREGEMPPKKAPSKADRDVFLKSLGGALHQASLTQQKQGRVTIRRLSRAEYETTLHDLLGISVDLQRFLPEDSLVEGFDKVSSGLSTSATHLVKYQHGADLALLKAFPPRPEKFKSKTVRLTGKAFYDSRPKDPKRASYVRIDGDAFVFRAALYKHGSIHTPRVPVAGRYRFRAKFKAAHHQGKPMPVDVGRISTDRFGHQDLEHLIGVQDAVENEWRTFEAEPMLIQGEQIYLSPRTIPHFRFNLNQKPLAADHIGPELAVEWVEIEGPLHSGYAYDRYFGSLKRVPDRFVADIKAGKKTADFLKWNENEFNKPQNRLRIITETPKKDAEKLIGRFLHDAYRRPPTKEQADKYVNRATGLLDAGTPLDEVLLRVYKDILCSTPFLFRLESRGELDDHELASRLSYLLWNSMPDEELFAVAAAGKLRDEKILREQTERMLTHWKGRRFEDHFAGHWLKLREFHEMKPDKLYSEYDELLAWSLPLETRLYFADMLQNNRPLTEFVHSDWSYLNERLARHYGIDGVAGMNMRITKLPADAHRGGVITHGSILKLTTNATYTSPIKRGAWILERIVGKSPSPPPPDVEAIEPDIRGAVTLREQMKLHKTQKVCATCHKKIDPPGFALENYDVLGGWRKRYRVAKGGTGIDHVALTRHPKKGFKAYLAKPVEPHGQTPDGKAFANIDEYKKILLEDPDQLARNLAEKLLVYGTGAPIEFADRQVVEQIVAETRKQKFGFRSLLHQVVQSKVFRSK